MYDAPTRGGTLKDFGVQGYIEAWFTSENNLVAFMQAAAGAH